MESYDNTFANGYYHSRGLTAVLIRIKNKIGWLPFQKTFAYLGSMPTNQQPTTSLEKFNLFITKLRDYSGTNILSELTTLEKSVLAGRFGGTIRYVTRALVVIPGVMGSRLNRSNGSRVWEPTTLQVAFTVDDNSYFSAFMKPYLYCDDAGAPISQLIPVNDEKGAQDAYGTLVSSLRNEFTSKNYNVIFFPYDWRLSCANVAAKLETALSSYDEAYIVAHSMGGLVASSYIGRSAANRKKVKELITIGTPFLGSAKTINVFEKGEAFDKFWNDLMMSTHIKDLMPNYASAYQLLPTSRYTNTIIKVDTASYSYSQSMNWLGQRPWALNAIGATKPMLSGAASFHNGLMNSSVHVSDTVPHYYISGINTDTKTTAVYTTNLFGNKTLSHFDNGSGDGTVILNSSENSTAYRSGYRFANVEHGDLVKHPTVIQHVKWILNSGFNSFRSNVSQMSSSFASSDTPAFENNKITIVLEGTEEIRIEDEFGNAIIEIGEGLYVRDSHGAEKPVGSVWVIDYETNRKQYNLNSGEYNMALSNPGEAKSASDMLVIYTESGEYKSYEAYDNLERTGSAQISITPDKTEIFADSGGNAARRKNVIAPSDVWDYNKLQEYNSDLTAQ